MARPEFLDLHCGCSRWLKALHFPVTILGLLALITASSPWGWRLVGCGILLAYFVLASCWASRLDFTGALRLFFDGTAFMQAEDGQKIQAFQGDRAWVSRWFSVVPIERTENGSRIHCVICASLNRADEYRRLLQWLRLKTSSSESRRIVL